VAEPVLGELATFVRVIESGSFARAARELGVPTSTVSRTVARLEQALGVSLLRRSTRSLRATPEGQSLFERAGPAVTALRHAARSVVPDDDQPRGTLRVTAPVDLGATLVAGVATELTRRHPELRIELQLTNRFVRLIEEGFDVAVRAAARLQDSSLVAKKVGSLEAWLYAAPDYLRRRGVPASLDELARHDLVLFRPQQGRSRWLLDDGRRESSFEVTGRLAGDDITFVRGALLAGAGIGLLPRVLCRDDLDAGRLVRVLPPLAQHAASLYVLHAAAPRVPARVAAFRDLLGERLKACEGDGVRRKRAREP
jgi:DNA-binding transcriptional LysR family regulator